MSLGREDNITQSWKHGSSWQLLETEKEFVGDVGSYQNQAGSVQLCRLCSVQGCISKWVSQS